MPSEIRRVAAEIEQYCRAHPNARDNIDGIAWWLQMQRQQNFRATVSDAVQLLVKQGVLERHALRDGSEVFGCTQPTKLRGKRNS